jgi:hypothetical protein
MGMSGSRITEMWSSHPASSNPQIKAEAASSVDFLLLIFQCPMGEPSNANTIPFSLNPESLEELR